MEFGAYFTAISHQPHRVRDVRDSRAARPSVAVLLKRPCSRPTSAGAAQEGADTVRVPQLAHVATVSENGVSISCNSLAPAFPHVILMKNTGEVEHFLAFATDELLEQWRTGAAGAEEFIGMWRLPPGTDEEVLLTFHPSMAGRRLWLVCISAGHAEASASLTIESQLGWSGM